MNTLRNIAVNRIETTCDITKGAASAIEKQAWMYEKYPLIIRRILSGQSLEEAIIELEPIKKEKEQELVAEGDLQCGKCHSKRIHRIEKQTRSADESATVFCCCSECGNRWKF